MDHAFLPGLQLSRRYYHETVEPLLRQHFGHVPHTAARIGTGSEVLGFDTARSADHEWGPRLQVFLHPDEADRCAGKIVDMLAACLPASFLGYPTHFVPTENEQIRRMQATDGPVHHRVDVTDLGTWFSRHLGFDPRRGVTVLDWLATPTQALAEATAGAVFHDGLAQLVAARSRLTWYPADPPHSGVGCRRRSPGAGMHNELGLTEPVDPSTRPYHDRPFRVLRAERFTAALAAGITTPEIRSLPIGGSIDQCVDSTDVLSDDLRSRAAARVVLSR